MADKPVEAQKSVPLSSEAQDAKEMMQQQLVRKMAVQMIAEAEEKERQRRIQEEKEPHPEDAVRKRALDQIITVQEDLVRALNRMKVKEAEEIERVQRITEEKKHDVHDELLRKAAAKQVKEQEEEERSRRIEESKDPKSTINTERYKTYDKLVMVQEDLLHHVRALKADAAMKEEQQRRITEENKHVVQEELMHKMSQKQAAAAEEKERERRVDEIEHLSEADAKHRLDIAHKMLDVQKELLASHPPIEAIHGTLSQQVLEDAKVYMQEQLLRKAAQKAADEAMDEEQKRRIAEAKDAKDGPYSEAKSDVLSELSRKAAIKEAKELADTTQQEYILAEQKARVGEDTVRKVHQKQADAAMQKEQKERIAEMESKPPHFVSDSLKKEIKEHGHAQ